MYGTAIRNGRIVESEIALLRAAQDDPDAHKAIASLPLDAWHAENIDLARRVVELHEQQIPINLSTLTQGQPTDLVDRVFDIAKLPGGTVPRLRAAEIREAYTVRKIAALGNALEAGDIDLNEYRESTRVLLDEVCHAELKPIDLSYWYQAPPQREWIIEGLILNRIFVAVIAPGGRSKSMLLLMWAISIATGRQLLKHFRPTKAMPVLLYNAEDNAEEFWHRAYRILSYFNLSDDEKALLSKNLFVFGGKSTPLQNKDLSTTQYFSFYRQFIIKHKIRVIILDPLVSLTHSEENSNTEQAALVGRFYEFTDAHTEGATVIAACHTNKQMQDLADTAALRGGTSVRDGARQAFNITIPSEADAQKYGMVEASRYIKLDVTKSNYTAGIAGGMFFKRLDDPFGGVLVDFDAEAAAREISGATVERVARVLVDVLGPNPSNLSAREITHEPAGKEMRHAVQDLIGVTVKRDTFSEAMKYALSRHMASIEDVKIEGLGRPKQVPRAGLSDIPAEDDKDGVPF